LLDLLPALPQSWPEGSVRGIRAKGNLELDFSWQGGRLNSLAVRNHGKEIAATIRAPGFEREIVLPSGETVMLPE
jgi:alpha-L-fucosidase 2